MADFAQQYGPYAVVAGGAQGIGAAYAQYIAARGVNLVLLDNAGDALEQFSAALRKQHSVKCIAIELDLGSENLLQVLSNAVGSLEVGLLVYNAGLADVGPFFKKETGLDFELKKIAVNVSGVFLLTHYFAKRMLARRRGGIVLMSSGAGLIGSPYYAHYSATKAYNIALGQALWAEFKPYNVDVLAVAAGMTLSTASAGFEHIEDRSQFQTPEALVEEAMQALGKQPLLVAGEQHRKNHELSRQLPPEQLIELMAQHAIENFLQQAPEQALDGD
ncbi:MAG: SDR family NAD(P)-dependent oxidoreductase [Gammaproteobacteria bacterium]|nr:SDR family NAD(P)-dependent oxidoreductase [Gammaproteobacteria bacterium]NND38419.1 SDR family NAD(P)-dependent oxidoreductase [Pseudomonadales bacterium]NNM12102.1 SDR family NAD(P)-dependent oxidoreductase [Pseudomonadales bacterium]